MVGRIRWTENIYKEIFAKFEFDEEEFKLKFIQQKCRKGGIMQALYVTPVFFWRGGGIFMFGVFLIFEVIFIFGTILNSEVVF